MKTSKQYIATALATASLVSNLPKDDEKIQISDEMINNANKEPVNWRDVLKGRNLTEDDTFILTELETIDLEEKNVIMNLVLAWLIVNDKASAREAIGMLIHKDDHLNFNFIGV